MKKCGEKMLKSSQFQFTGNINVQTMERQAGIFIAEKNTAVGWNAHGKQNKVFGDVSGECNILLHNISILNDPDFIDTPIDDRDINFSFETPGNENESNINLDSVNVTTMLNNSSLLVGKGQINGIDANQKQNVSHGNTYGNMNHITKNLSINNDPDMIDAIIDDQDIKIANTNWE